MLARPGLAVARLLRRRRGVALVVALGAVGLAIVTLQSRALAQDAPQGETEPQGPGARTCAKNCHQKIFDHKVMHGPTLSDCEACHVQGDPEQHTFVLIKPKETLCLRCHSLPRTGAEHTPVREGKCLECHDPHGSDQPRMLVADPQRDLCSKCHQQDFASAKYVHGPVAVGACIVCHAPHASEHPKLLLDEPKALCVHCHAEVQADATSAGMHKHGALDEGCTRCHDPHASAHPYQLRSEAPDLCLSCHREKFGQMIGSSSVVHGAVSVVGGCTQCHAAHGSRLPNLARGTEPGICLGCHDKPVKTPDGRELVNMAALLEQNPNHHGPIREGLCTACHSPHAGDHFRLLVEDYPPQFYAPFDLDSFKLCFRCHISELVLNPSAHGLTQFRDGDRNLHFVHVNQQKGRTCRACHEVHASKRPAHIREAVPFGSAGWMLEINYRATEDGGSCAPGCHQPKSYSRGPAPASTSKSPLVLPGGLKPTGDSP
ncbi:MAG: cytochrome c3 family protein [Phycisphaerales bacterium]